MECVHLTPSNYVSSLQNILVYKDECVKCFKDAQDPQGINVCLQCLSGGCSLHSLIHSQLLGHPLSLNLKASPVTSQVQPQKITRLAIGKPGGGAYTGQEWQVDCSLLCLECQVPLNPTLQVQTLIDSILQSNSAYFQNSIEAWELQLHPCEHVLLLDQSAQKIVQKSLAKCSQCDLSSNLWLCMTCGNLGCGRKHYDGSGGNNHGVQHFQTFGHPVACKIGTITPQGSASIHCYSCDQEILDPALAAHMAHFGIQIGNLQKTEKTVAELELEQNLNFTLSKTVQDGQVLQCKYGSWFTGLENLGNSCYLNSIVQVLFSFSEWTQRYLEDSHIETCLNSANCLVCQMIKLVRALQSGQYSVQKWTVPVQTNPGQFTAPQEYQDGIKPQMFKSLIGRGHPEFSTNRQQDALEFFQHLLSSVMKAQKANNTSKLYQGGVFDFHLVTKLKCNQCRGARYSSTKQNVVTVQVPISLQQDSKQLTVPFEKILATFTDPETVEYQCPICNCTQVFTKKYMMETFPEVLVLIVNRFVHQEWVPKKLQCSIQPPLQLDLNHIRLMNQGENPLPEGNQAPQIDLAQLAALMEMGFSENQCKHALINTGNSGLEMAAGWLFENLDNPDILEPPAGMGGGEETNNEGVQMLQAMGFTAAQAKIGLSKCDNNVERAIDFLFSHQDDMEVEEEEPEEVKEDNRPANYRLDGVVTHLGVSVHSGHYVAHVRRGDEWVLYNDIKVAASNQPVLGKGYIYFLRRISEQ